MRSSMRTPSHINTNLTIPNLPNQNEDAIEEKDEVTHLNTTNPLKISTDTTNQLEAPTKQNNDEITQPDDQTTIRSGREVRKDPSSQTTTIASLQK